MPNLPIFVISLARAAQRRANITAHLRQIGAIFEMVDAVDGKAMTPSEIAEVVDPRVSFHPGVIGCYLSHISVYAKILEHRFPAALVIEDDVFIKSSIVRVDTHKIPYSNFDYFYLDCGYPPGVDIYYNLLDCINISGIGPGYRLNAGPALTHGYIITNSAAKIRLENALPIRAPIDIHKNNQLRFYSMIRPNIGAILNENSMDSLTRYKNTDAIRLRFLKRTRLYFHLRNMLHPSMLARRRKITEMKQTGSLPVDGDWRPLPDGTVFPQH